jgi:hypothetical protein
MAAVNTIVTPIETAIIDAYRRINGGTGNVNNVGEKVTFDTENGKQLAALGANLNDGRWKESQGVYAAFPTFSPKYARHVTNRYRENFDTIARMYVKLGGGQYKAFLNSLSEQGSKDIGSVLAGETTQKDKNSAPVGGLGYIDMLISSIRHNLNEKYQIVEVLSDNYVSFFFGQQAPIFLYTGFLINTWQDDWMIQMLRMYRDIARGTQLARRGLLLYLRYDSLIVSGSMVNLDFTLLSENEMVIPFNFQLLVKKVHIIYSGLTTPTVVPTGDAFIPPNVALVETKYQPLVPFYYRDNDSEVPMGFETEYIINEYGEPESDSQDMVPAESISEYMG